MNGKDTLNPILQDMLGGLEIHTESMWNYVKLPNGVAIAWGTKAIITPKLNVEGVVRWFTDVVQLPAGLFKEILYANGQVSANWLSCATIHRYILQNLSEIRNYICFFVDVPVGEYIEQHHLVIGRWK